MVKTEMTRVEAAGIINTYIYDLERMWELEAAGWDDFAEDSEEAQTCWALQDSGSEYMRRVIQAKYLVGLMSEGEYNFEMKLHEQTRWLNQQGRF